MLGRYLTILRRYLDFDHLKSLDLSEVASASPTIEAGKGVKDECKELLKMWSMYMREHHKMLLLGG